MKLHTTPFSLLILCTLLLGLAGVVLAEREYEGEHEEAWEDDAQGRFAPWLGRSRPDITPVSSQLYAEECGSCHFAYPPGLLPGASWERILATLEEHFGENAELSAESRNALRDYLLSASADQAEGGLSRRILISLGNAPAPLRITETPFFRHEHDEIPPRLVQNNPQVLSFSQCDACHGRAAQGSFREHEIRIPGYGAWDD